MAKEIERKFLLAEGKSVPASKYKYLLIKQGYISVEKNKQVRVRITKSENKKESANICVKFTENLVRDEFEFPIPLKDAKSLYSKCKWNLEKNRVSFQCNGEHYDLDMFPNGITFVEVEFKSLKAMEKWVKPDWIGEEITGFKKYSNIVMSKQNLKF